MSELNEGDDMRKLGSASGASAAPAEQTKTTAAPAGEAKVKAAWGAKPKDAAADAQKEAIDKKLTREPSNIRDTPEDRVAEDEAAEQQTGFSTEVQEQLAGAGKEPATKTTRTRAKAADKEPEPVPYQVQPAAPTCYPLSVVVNIDVAAIIGAFFAAGSDAPDEAAADMIANVLKMVRGDEG